MNRRHFVGTLVAAAPPAEVKQAMLTPSGWTKRTSISALSESKAFEEVGITGAGAAAANAVSHASGIRVRDLPITRASDDMSLQNSQIQSGPPEKVAAENLRLGHHQPFLNRRPAYVQRSYGPPYG
jgi:hypothetical protein